jgi:hypothetical protein
LAFSHAKCAELEVQLQQALDELSSTQLIVQMLRKGYIQDNHNAMLSQRMEANLEVDNGWKEMRLKDPKRTEGKMQSNYKEQIMTENHYEVLEMESDMFDDGNTVKWMQENKNETDQEINNNRQKEYTMHNEPCCSVAKEFQKEANRKITVQHNLQIPRSTRHQVNTKAELITHAIPSIINGRLSRVDPS